MSSLFHVLQCNHSLGNRVTDIVSWTRKATRIDIWERGQRDSRPAPVVSGGDDKGLADPPTSLAEMTLWLRCGAVSGGWEEGLSRCSRRTALVLWLSVCDQLTN